MRLEELQAQRYRSWVKPHRRFVIHLWFGLSRSNRFDFYQKRGEVVTGTEFEQGELSLKSRL
jgi:hypothetical protein